MRDFIMIFFPVSLILLLIDMTTDSDFLLLIIYFCLISMYFNISYYVIEPTLKKIKTKENETWIKHEFEIFEEELDYKNKEIKKYARKNEKRRLIEYCFYMYLFWSIYYLCLIINYFSKKQDNIFDKIPNIFHFYTPFSDYLNKKEEIKIVEEKKVVEDGKEYDVSIYNNCTIEYRYKGLLHRENKKPAVFKLENTKDSMYFRKNKYYAYGEIINIENYDYELNKIRLKTKLNKF